MNFKNLNILFAAFYFFISQAFAMEIPCVQRELYLGISENKSILVKSALENGANVNLVNPITRKTPLYDSLVNLHKLVGKKFGWMTRFAIATTLAICTIPPNIITIQTIKVHGLKNLLVTPANAEHHTIQRLKENRNLLLIHYIGTISALITSIYTGLSGYRLKNKIKNAQSILNLILSQPNLIIDAASIEFCKTNLPQMKQSLEKTK